MPEAAPLWAAHGFSPHGRLVLALAGIAGLCLVYRWLVRRSLGAGHGVVWTGVFASLIVVAALPGTVVWVGWIAGSQEPFGGLRLGAFLVAFVLLLYLSVKTSLLQRRIEELVQALALREAREREEERARSAADAQDEHA